MASSHCRFQSIHPGNHMMCNGSCTVESAGNHQLCEDLLRAYLDYYLRRRRIKNGYQHTRGPAGNGLHQTSDSSKGQMFQQLHEAVIKLTDAYQHEFHDKLDEMSRNWIIQESKAKESFYEVLDALFADGYNWGRFVSLFIFAGIFARKCLEQNMNLEEQIIEWSSDYITDKLWPWMEDNNGWFGFLRFYDNRDSVPPFMDNGVLKRMLTFAGAGLGLVALTSYFVNKA